MKMKFFPYVLTVLSYLFDGKEFTNIIPIFALQHIKHIWNLKAVQLSGEFTVKK